MEIYDRNRLYIQDSEQLLIRDTAIFLGGCGIGSAIAECALRMGFEKLTIVDGDTVERSNLNRQNYIEQDISRNKAEVLQQRLLGINPKAEIKIHTCFINHENIVPLIQGHHIAVNALDFSTDIPLFFDSVCQQLGIYVLHPYNLGWAGLLAVISPTGKALSSIARGKGFNELDLVEYVLGYMRFWHTPQTFLEEVLAKYRAEKTAISPPQLSVGSWLVAAMCTEVLFNIAIGKEVKEFPQFYYKTLRDD